MSNFQLVTYHINNQSKKGSRYLQFHLIASCIFVALSAFIINEFVSHPIAPLFLVTGVTLFSLAAIIFFSFKRQAEKISLESDHVRLHSSNVWGKKTKIKISYRSLKYSYNKEHTINFINPRSLKIYPSKEGVICLDTGYSGWKKSDLQEIAKHLVSRGVYNRYKFDKSKGQSVEIL